MLFKDLFLNVDGQILVDEWPLTFSERPLWEQQTGMTRRGGEGLEKGSFRAASARRYQYTSRHVDDMCDEIWDLDNAMLNLGPKETYISR
jgi:hypothetical protein